MVSNQRQAKRGQYVTVCEEYVEERKVVWVVYIMPIFCSRFLDIFTVYYPAFATINHDVRI